MCIIFIYDGSNIQNSDYSLIVAANRDEYYDRPSKIAAPWEEDGNIIGGRDMKPGSVGGSWLAMCPRRKKLAALLNNSDKAVPNAKSRGNLVNDFVSGDATFDEYVVQNVDYFDETNGFTLVTVTMETDNNKIMTYNNCSEETHSWSESCIGFSNSVPNKPLNKVKIGTEEFKKICEKHNSLDSKSKLIDELVKLLKWDKSHLPDHQLQNRYPKFYQIFSSIHVKFPANRYGTRTHTIILVSKSGKVQFIEQTMQEPIDLDNEKWTTSEYNLEL